MINAIEGLYNSLYDNINIKELRCFASKNITLLNAKRFGSIVHPFLALNSKTAGLASAGTFFSRCYSLWNPPSDSVSDKKTKGEKWIKTVFFVSPFALSIIFPKHKETISNSIGFVEHLYDFLTSEKDKKGSALIHILHQAILLSVASKKTTPWIALSLLSPIAVEVFQAYKHYKNYKNNQTKEKKNIPFEMIASILLALIHYYKFVNYLQPNLALFKAPKIEPKKQELFNGKPVDSSSDISPTQSEAADLQTRINTQQKPQNQSTDSISSSGASATINAPPREITSSEWENLCSNLPTGDFQTKIQLYTLLKAHGFLPVLRDFDLSKKSLWANISFDGLSCYNCNFSNILFCNVTFDYFTASNCKFSGATLDLARINHSKFIACDLSNLSMKFWLSSSGNTIEDCIGNITLLGQPTFTTPKIESPPSVDEKDLNSNEDSPNESSFEPAEEIPDEFDGVERTFKNPASPFTDFDHELNGDLDAKIEAKRFKIIGKDQTEYDFGSYFHGFGKYLVKGANIHFRKIVFGNGAKGIELSFRVNYIYHKRLRQIIKGFDKMNDEERRDFARQFQSRGMMVDRNVNFSLGQLAIKGENEKTGSIEPTADEVTLESFGSLTVGKKYWHNLKDQVKITLNEGATLESFHHFLSIFGLEDALKKSTEDDLEKINLGILFRTFFPSQASVLEKDGTFFTLSPQELKQKIIESIPKMEKIFNQYTVEKHELFPGYVKTGVVVAKKAHALGARALTTALTGLNEDKPLDLDQIVSILKNGLLSQEMREKNGISASGLNDQDGYMKGGALSIYTQMITQTDLSKNKKIDSFYYGSPVRLYLSLDALNQGSYQYLYDSYGEREDSLYRIRFTIMEFIKRWPSFFKGHEIMIPDRVLPEFIKAISVKSEEVKQQILAQMRLENLLKIDQNGQETFNEIPVDEFIRTEDHLTPELVKRCSPQSPPEIG